ncbi:PspC domain-containing protein [Paenibacillus sp. M1]|uniref:PspC domain-containing protein n=1 Tax=Paenibacillus haidiansis TaxID=1574488 RepID=A0ABU7VYY1_9BACL
MARLYRSRRDRWFTGLLGGLGEYFGISSTALRILTIISVPFTGGTTIFIYLIAALVVSKEPYQPFDPYYNNGWQGNGGAGGYGGQGGYNGYGAGNPGNPGSRGYGYGPGPGQQPPFKGNPFQGNNPYSGTPGAGSPGFGGGEASNLDSMMEDIEKKAMKKELEELRKKLSDYEKGEV